MHRKDYFKLPKFYLILCGSWGLDTKNWKYPTLAWLAKILHSAFQIFFLYMLFELSILILIAAYFNIEKGFDDTFLAVLNAIIYMWNFYTFLFYYFTRAAFDDFFKRMNGQLRLRSAPGLTYVSIEPGYALARKVLNMWQMTVLTAASSYNFIPIVNQQRILPLPVWYPIDVYVSDYDINLSFLLLILNPTTAKRAV